MSNYTEAQVHSLSPAAALNEGFYTGVAWMHAQTAVALLNEYRQILPDGTAQTDSLRLAAVELNSVVKFRTATSPADTRTVTEQMTETLSLAHVYLTEANLPRSRCLIAIESAVCAARRAVETQEV
tara:strand:- start:347 stop:724 length:378 start_codon:yes stop_codon:yes gene_type:complete